MINTKRNFNLAKLDESEQLDFMEKVVFPLVCNSLNQIEGNNFKAEVNADEMAGIHSIRISSEKYSDSDSYVAIYISDENCKLTICLEYSPYNENQETKIFKTAEKTDMSLPEIACFIGESIDKLILGGYFKEFILKMEAMNK